MERIRPSLSRRELLTAAVGAGGAMLLGPACRGESPVAAVAPGAPGAGAPVASVEARLAQAKARTIGIDIHNHVYVAGTEPQHGPPQPAGEVPDLATELKRSGFTAVSAGFVLDFQRNEKPGDARDNFLRWLDAIDAQLTRDQMRRALTLKDLQSAHDQGKPTIVQSVEGAQFIEGRLERIGEVYTRGLRHLQLLHDKDDLVTPLGDISNKPAHLGGLTAFGVDVVKECNRLGIVVDLAHGNHETVQAAVRISTQPILVSHTSLDTQPGTNARRAQMMAPRLISKEHGRVVADAGGVIGVWTNLYDSVPEYVQGLRGMVNAVGVDHVAIGTDTDLLSPRAGHSTNTTWGGQNGLFDRLVAEMLTQGFTNEEIEKVGGGNFCRVFDKVTAGHT